ncbi:uncharacterized protein LOC143631840 [Bidens hawaiensis]|uniref:uncharacterized protein LOC143631840 n=1 Tax=Bidens hawaiensis TaxID=980011 RepID=UPI00404B7A88
MKLSEHWNVGTKALTPSAEELLRRIQVLEACHAHIKQQISKLLQQPNPEHLRRAIGDTLSLKLREAQFLNIMQSMGQAIHVFDLKYRINFWNRTAEEIYGFTADQVYGKTPTEILVDPKDAVLADYLLERTVSGESWSGEFPVTNNRGETFVVICTNTPFRDENRRLIGGICISSDSRPYQLMKPSSKSYNFIRLMNEFEMQRNAKDKLEEWMGKKRCVWPWKANERGESLVDKLCNFGWQRLHVNQEEACLNGNIKINAASGVWTSTLCVNSTSSLSNDDTSNSTSTDQAIVKVQMNSDYEILWEDLIIRQQIGQGSCGTVYHGLWCGSDVAIKLFTHQEYSDDVMVSYKQEVSLMKRLRHPNILLFMGAVTASPKHLCIVTEFLPRGSLFRILQRNSARLDWRRRICMAIDIARGMNYLHHSNPPIVHRDLKSSNLLVDKDCTVKVGDFGLSHIKHHTYLNTKSGKGTPQWMAPEIICSEQADEKSDVYSYGVVLWEIVTEKVPWDDLNPMQVIAAVGFMNRRLEIPKDVDPLWASLIQSCWCSEPKSRPTFQEILHKLKDLKKKFAVERRR